MNGRIYDPLVGRMFSPDPFIGDAANSQAYNKYSYVLNNPLKYTDPSGNLFVGSISAMFREFASTAFTKGGLEFWNRGTSGQAWSEFRNSFREGGRVNNALRIDCGVFAWTDNKTVFGNLGSIFSRLTWESQQTEWGKTGAHVRNNLGRIDNIEYYEGATIINEDRGKWRWGITLGSYIHSHNIGPIDGYQNHLLRHEYGHTMQSRMLGPLYLTQVGVGSLLGSAISGDHKSEWYETQANRMSHRYHNSGMRRKIGYLNPDQGGSPWLRENERGEPVYRLDYNPNWYWIFFHPINPFWFAF